MRCSGKSFRANLMATYHASSGKRTLLIVEKHHEIRNRIDSLLEMTKDLNCVKRNYHDMIEFPNGGIIKVVPYQEHVSVGNKLRVEAQVSDRW